MRNLKKAGDLAELPNVIIMSLNVTDAEQIRQTCRKALAQYDVDVLLNNAGYGIMAPFRANPQSALGNPVPMDGKDLIQCLFAQVILSI